MCWTSKIERSNFKSLFPKIAKDNICVVKSGHFKKDTFESFYKKYCYSKYVITEEVKLRPFIESSIMEAIKSFFSKDLAYLCINEGYHSYGVSILDSSLLQGFEVGLFVIPKGAKYYYDPLFNEYVSSCLMYIGPIRY